MKITIASLSSDYKVKQISEKDIEAVLHLCSGNPLYYEFCPPAATRESIEEDLTALPPNTSSSDKYYVGFYQGDHLIAVMDLISGYPRKDTAFIGFFMTDQSIQKSGTGTAIIRSVCDYLKRLDFRTVQLAWIKGNPQAEHFWIKNHFVKIRETTSTASQQVILAEREL